MWHSGSGQGDVNEELVRAEGGSGLTSIDSGLPSSVYVVAYCESGKDRWDVWSFWEWAEVATCSKAVGRSCRAGPGSA